MSQTSLLKFFSPKAGSPKAGAKRLSTSFNDDSPKKPKTDDSGSRSPLTPLSSNQVQNSPDNFESKRIEAKMKLLNKSTQGLVTNFGSSWFKVLEPEFSKEYFKKLSSKVATERSGHTVYPSVENVFSWTQLCEFRAVKVVILGQDPYHGPRQAHGLCFSVLRPTPPPPSLVNMYKELQNDIEGFEIPSHGDLSGWARQGVLLLNAVLTVVSGQANSHKDIGWETFTDAVIETLSKQRRGLVFILWGAYAQKKGARIDKSKHRILKGPHPSPLSAHRGFFGCKHFSLANAYLKESGKSPIDWGDLP